MGSACLAGRLKGRPRRNLPANVPHRRQVLTAGYFGEGPSRKFAAFAIISTEYPYRQAHPKDKLIVSLEEISHEAEDLIRELKDPEPDAKIDAGFVWSFYVYPKAQAWTCVSFVLH